MVERAERETWKGGGQIRERRDGVEIRGKKARGRGVVGKAKDGEKKEREAPERIQGQKGKGGIYRGE